MKKKIITKNPKETQNFAKKLAIFLKTRRPPKEEALVLALEGDLGAGKTTFLQGLAKGLGIKEKILSPSFLIMRKFEIQNSKFKNFYHFDCYRIKKPQEILSLGWKEIISNFQNIVAIEWPEGIQKILPKNTIWIKLEFRDEKIRRIKLKI